MVQAFVYATGGEMADGAQFADLERHLTQSLMDRCLTKSGFHYPVQSGSLAAGLFDNELFPDVDRMARAGQLVPGGPQAAVRASAAGQSKGLIVPDNQRAAYDKDLKACTNEVTKPFSTLDSAAYALQTDWFQEVNRIQASAAVSASRARYTSCMEKAGVPSGSADNFAHFMAWQTGEMTRGKDEQALVVIDHKWAVIFVRCAGPTVHLQEKMQTQAKQRFLQEHFQEVRALQGLATTAVAQAQRQLGTSAG